MLLLRLLTTGALVLAFSGAGAWAQEPAASVEPPASPAPRNFKLAAGTRIPMNLLNSVSTRNGREGDRVYLETIFPIMANGKIVIPPGSSVAGTVTRVKRPGRVKGKGELFLRFDQLILPNGVTRDFRSRLGAMDGRATEGFDREEGKITSDTDRAGEVYDVATAGAVGAGVGAAVTKGTLGGLATGSAIGAGAALMGVFLTRGPDAVLAKGSTLEMVLDREMAFLEGDLDFSHAPTRLSGGDGAGPAAPAKRSGGVLGRGRVL